MKCLISLFTNYLISLLLVFLEYFSFGYFLFLFEFLFLFMDLIIIFQLLFLTLFGCQEIDFWFLFDFYRSLFPILVNCFTIVKLRFNLPINT